MSHHAVISYLASLHWSGASVESYAECPQYFYKRTLVGNRTKYFLAEKTKKVIDWAEPYWQHCGWIAKPSGEDRWLYTHPDQHLAIIEELINGKPYYMLVSARSGIPVDEINWRSLAEAIDHLSVPEAPEAWDDGDTMPVDVTAAPPLQWRYG